MTKTTITIIVLVVLGLGAWLMFGRSVNIEDPIDNGDSGGQTATTTPSDDSQQTLRLYRPLIIKGHTITPFAVTEDSRCAKDVQCIWAGRVTVALKIQSDMGDTVMEMEPGETVTTETIAITLDKVDPYPISTHKITDDEYLFYVTIEDHKSGI